MYSNSDFKEASKIKLETSILASFHNGALRKGKWTFEEEIYANKIIYMFNKGMLRIPLGTTLRSYLADRLHW